MRFTPKFPLAVAFFGFMVSTTLGCSKSEEKPSIDVRLELHNMIMDELQRNDAWRSVELHDYGIEVGDPDGTVIRVKTTEGKAKGLEKVTTEDIFYDPYRHYITLVVVVDSFNFHTRLFLWNPDTLKDMAIRVSLRGSLKFMVNLWFDLHDNEVNDFSMSSLSLKYEGHHVDSMPAESYYLTQKPSFREALRRIFEEQLLQDEIEPILNHILLSRKYTVPRE